METFSLENLKYRRISDLKSNTERMKGHLTQLLLILGILCSVMLFSSRIIKNFEKLRISQIGNSYRFYTRTFYWRNSKFRLLLYFVRFFRKNNNKKRRIDPKQRSKYLCQKFFVTESVLITGKIFTKSTYVKDVLTKRNVEKRCN